MKNDELKYYRKHNISPEHQDINNINVHYARRNKLYRQCGIPEIAFRDAEILEVGAGCGYNTLAFFHWDCKHVDIVEANQTGIKDMQKLFREQKINAEKFNIHECLVEEYITTKKYDIIIAEGFIQRIGNQEEVIEKLKSLVNDKGIIVITCGDRVDFFIELIKRLIGWTLTQNISNYEEKVEYLEGIFKPQLSKLRGVSKPSSDWVKDMIFNPEVNNEHELSLAKAVEYFSEDFEVLGTSPQMFTDYSWSKDIWYDYKKDYQKQFNRKRLSLLMANMQEVELPIEQVNVLIGYFETIVNAEVEYESTLDIERVNDILEVVNSMEQLVKQYMPDEFQKVFDEIKDVLSHLQRNTDINMEGYPHFFAAFGRTQQYISFVKK